MYVMQLQGEEGQGFAVQAPFTRVVGENGNVAVRAPFTGVYTGR